MSFERPRVVFAYDFDGTLAPGNMQDHAFIPHELGMDHGEFWEEVRILAEAQRGDPILAYMHLMLEKARERGLELSLESWRRRGATIPLFPGVEGWFERQNRRADELQLDLRHIRGALTGLDGRTHLLVVGAASTHIQHVDLDLRVLRRE